MEPINSACRLLKAVNRTLPGFEKEQEEEWKGSFRFVIGADPQLGFLSYMESGRRDEWSREVELTRRAVQDINKLKPRPRFFIICGDLVNEYRYEDIRGAQVSSLRDALSELDPSIPVVCVCGNHDVGNRPTTVRVERYRNDFGDDFFVFWCGGLRFIVLNSQYYEDSSLVKEEALEQSRWLDKVIQEGEGVSARTVVFQHLPWSTLRPELVAEMKDKLKRAGVRFVFCGHFHLNTVQFYSGLQIIVTSAIGMQLGDDKSGFRIVDVTEKSVEHRYVTLGENDTETDRGAD